MSETTTLIDEGRRTERGHSSGIQSRVRAFGALHVLAGLLGFVGPAVEGNDDGLVNVDPGLFLGRVAVNGPHALLHVLIGILGLRASRDAGAARGYMGLNAAFFGAFAVMGWRKFGFERGVHWIGPFALDGWGNLGHGVLSAFGLGVYVGSER